MKFVDTRWLEKQKAFNNLDDLYKYIMFIIEIVSNNID